MREMKNSGIEWIGDIPSDFEMIKIKYIINIEKGKLPQNTNTEGLGEIYVGASEMNGKTPSLYTTDDLLKCKEDDILLLWDGANAGLIANGLCGVVSSTVARCRVNSNRYHPQYIYYTLKNAERYYKDKVTGTTIPHMSSKYIDDTYILNLSFSEQKKIADFLDEKCAEINTVIEKTKATIEEYKKLKQSVITQAVTKGIRPNRPMKDSGIEWIGEIPEDWKINTAFQIFTQVNNKNVGLVETNLLSLSYGKIKRKSIDTIGGLLPESFDGYNIIEADDIVLRLTDLQNDHTSLRVGLSTERGIVTSAYLTLRNRSKNLPMYLYYYLHSFDVAKGFYGMGAGVRQGLNWDGLKRLKIISPSFQEQQEIINYLDKKCSAIDELIAKKTSLLSELERYKKSLIYEYVTGKKEV